MYRGNREAMRQPSFRPQPGPRNIRAAIKALLLGTILLSVPVSLRAQRPSPTQIAYTYRLPVNATNTTLGVKDSSDTLIRTIFGGKAQAAGTYSGIWDGRTDSGAVASGGPFRLVLLYGNPVYTWEGKVGNTSNHWEGINRWESFYESLPYARITFVKNIGWTTEGYSEGTLGLGYFNDTDPNTPNPVSPYWKGNNINFIDITNDGQNLYAISASQWPSSASFATKFDAHTGQPSSFTNGKATVGPRIGQGGYVTYAYPGTTMSDIDVDPDSFDAPPTSIAVQTGGNLLAIGHGDYYSKDRWPASELHRNNVIKFFDKNTGLPAGHTANLANPVSMAFSSQGLWVIAENGLNLISSPGIGNKVTQPIKGLSNPAAVDVNRSNDHVYLLDGGNSQQLKEYDANYHLVRTYGQLGGYSDCNPTVAHDRLMIDNKAINGSTELSSPMLVSIRSEENGDVWITDTLDVGRSGRLQHLTPNGSTFRYVSEVQYSAVNYLNGGSHTQPTRLFIGMLEYTLDYSVTNRPGDPTAPGGNNFWRLTRAWTVGAGGACGSNDIYGIIPGRDRPSIVASEQLSNGHVYATIHSSWKGTTPIHQVHLVELPLDGKSSFRYIRTMPFPPNALYPMDRNGNFRYPSYSHGGQSSPGTMNIIPLTGFDANNNPVYGPVKTVASWTFDENTQPIPQGSWSGGLAGSNFEPTTGGVYAIARWSTYDTTKTTNYPHIGGVLPGRSTYLFTVNPEACSPSFLTNGSYPCSKGSGNLGTGIYTEGRHIISAYGSQTSPWEPEYWHYWEDGMFIGQFGPQMMNDGTATVTNGARSSRLSGAMASQFDPKRGWQRDRALDVGEGENMGYAKLIGINGDLYLHIVSEFWQVPSQIWHISNLSSLHEIAGTGSLGSSVQLSTQLW
jgi:hypothetical protein